MNEDACDIHDVTNAASDLVAVGCSIGMAHFSDGITRLRFLDMILLVMCRLISNRVLWLCFSRVWLIL